MKEQVPGTEIAMRILVGMAVLFLGGYGTAALLGHAGSLAGNGSGEPAFSSQNMRAWLTGYADNYLAAKAYDRAQAAASRGDTTEYTRQNDLIDQVHRNGAGLIDTFTASEVLVAQGEKAEQTGAASSGEDRDEQMAYAAQCYRKALALDPGFRSSRSELLNALGYYLADRGTSQGDYSLAETLLHRAVALETDRLNKASGPDIAFIGYDRAMGPCDSLAWALFKEGKFSEAQAVEERAMKDIQQYSVEAAAPALDGSIPFHLGQIYRAEGRDNLARVQFQEAMQLKSFPDISGQAQSAIESMTSIGSMTSAGVKPVKSSSPPRPGSKAQG